MYKCTMDETRHVKCKDLKLKCTTPYSSSNGGDFGHMLELFMVVDFPNGIELAEKNGILLKFPYQSRCFFISN